MRTSAAFLLLLFILVRPVAGQEKLTAERPLTILAWAGIPEKELSVERLAELKDMGINTCLSTFKDTPSMMKALDLARQAGLKMVTSCPELKSQTAATVKKIMQHPALAGYFLMDEPLRKDFQELGEWARRIVAADKLHYCFVNLIAAIHPTLTQALGTNSYADYLETFVHEVPVKQLSFDFYPVLNEGLHERWYEGLEIVSSEARKEGIPFWAFALASSYNELHPTPTLAALRLQMFSNLAYGAQGLEYWAYWMNQGLRSAPIGINGRRTPVYDRIRTVNREIRDLEGVFSGARVISVHHTGLIIPRGTTRLEKLPEAIDVFETEGTGALVSVLEKGDNTFFVVVNRDLQASMTMTIHGDKTLKKVLKDGTLVPAGVYENTSEIEPGDMAVYMFPAKAK